jgi:hypothetical protein
MFLHVCMLICAIIISSVSAFYSIIGLTTLYASQYWAVVIMASALELGKVTTATWCHQHHYSISWWIKSYLGFAIVVLMALTSMGIFGFLTRAHIDQQLKLELASGGDSADIDIQIEIKKNALDDLDKQIKQLDDTIALQKANRAMNELTNQRNTRNKLNNQRGTVATELGTLKSSKLKADAEVRKVEAEVGPVRYLADWWYGGNSTKEQKERAVTWVTIMIVSVFDPLAIFMFMAVSSALHQRRLKREKTAEDAKKKAEEAKMPPPAPKAPEPEKRTPMVIYKKRIGRPKGSKNKMKVMKQKPEPEPPKPEPEPEPQEVRTVTRERGQVDSVHIIEKDPSALDMTKVDL